MPISRKAILASAIAPCLVGALAGTPVQAGTSTIPDYFFKEWTVATNCTEQHAGLAAHVAAGLKFKISADTLAADGSYVFQAEDVGQQHWAANWSGMKLQYRAGTEMKTLPADFECIPGQEATSPFLAMSNYAQASEPYYEHRHWYGVAKIHGQMEHILIFPSNAATGPTAVILMQSVNSPGTVQLDDNGVIQMH
jgi:hypothetical protein